MLLVKLQLPVLSKVDLVCNGYLRLVFDDSFSLRVFGGTFYASRRERKMSMYTECCILSRGRQLA